MLLADDHAMVAEGLRALLKDSFDLVGVVHDGRALLDAAEKFRPDVIVTDVSMPLMNGLEAIRQIRARRPDAKVIVLTMHRDTHLAAEAFRAGVSGYLLKVSPSEELINAIREVAQGRSYVTTLLAKDLITLLIEAGGPVREDGRVAYAAPARSSAPSRGRPHHEGSRFDSEHLTAHRRVSQVRDDAGAGRPNHRGIGPIRDAAEDDRGVMSLLHPEEQTARSPWGRPSSPASWDEF